MGKEAFVLSIKGLGGEVTGKGGKSASRALSRKFKAGPGKLLMEWPDRSKALMRKVAHRSAESALVQIKEKIPKSDAWRSYRESLQLVEVKVDPSEGHAFMVRSNPDHRGVSNLDSRDTLLYVRGHRRLKEIPPGVRILEKYSPWTLKTLPFTPKKTEGKIITRKVGKRIADKVTKRRLRDKHKWRSELSREGIRPLPIRVEEVKATAVPDLAFEAVRLEFGVGQKPVPHWRPAVMHSARQGYKALLRDPNIKASMSKPNFTGWKRWGKIKLRQKIAEGAARKFTPFQKKLGLRVSR